MSTLADELQLQSTSIFLTIETLLTPEKPLFLIANNKLTIVRKGNKNVFHYNEENFIYLLSVSFSGF